jgi:hypothetical protein
MAWSEGWVADGLLQRRVDFDRRNDADRVVMIPIALDRLRWRDTQRRQIRSQTSVDTSMDLAAEDVNLCSARLLIDEHSNDHGRAQVVVDDIGAVAGAVPSIRPIAKTNLSANGRPPSFLLQYDHSVSSTCRGYRSGGKTIGDQHGQLGGLGAADRGSSGQANQSHVVSASLTGAGPGADRP